MSKVPEFNQLWRGIEPRELDDGTIMTIGMIINHPSIQPILQINITTKKGKTTTYTYLPTNGISGNFEMFKFKVGKKKRISFPYELESFEINTGLVKTKFKRKQK